MSRRPSADRRLAAQLVLCAALDAEAEAEWLRLQHYVDALDGRLRLVGVERIVRAVEAWDPVFGAPAAAARVRLYRLRAASACDLADRVSSSASSPGSSSWGGSGERRVGAPLAASPQSPSLPVSSFSLPLPTAAATVPLRPSVAPEPPRPCAVLETVPPRGSHETPAYSARGRSAVGTPLRQCAPGCGICEWRDSRIRMVARALEVA